MKIRFATLLLSALGWLLLAGPAEAAVHGEATLESSAPTAPAGGSITLSGSLFVPGEAHRLVLRGTLDDYELGEVTAASDSTFTREIRIPAGARPGQYRLVAIAPDGDEVATLDLPVLAAAGRPAAASGEPAAGGSDPGTPTAAAGPSPEARADEMPIERSRAGVEWGVIGLVIGLAGGLGLGLVRRG